MTLGVPRPDDHFYRLLIGYDAEDRPVFAPPYASILGTGAPRTGKSRGIAIPAVASFPGSAIVVSVRGDVLEQTKEARKRRGPVAVFDPGALFPDIPERAGWNLLDRCRDFQVAVETAQHLGDLGVPKSSGSSTDWQFWGAQARKLVAPALFAAANHPGYGIADTVRWVQTREEFELRGLLQSVGGGRRGDEGEQALQMIDGIWDTEDRVRSGIYATADAMLTPFQSPALAEAVSGDLDIADFLAIEGSTLYVVAPATHQSVYAPIVTSLIGAALDAAVERAENTDDPARVLVMLDEAGNVGQIPELRSRASTSMGYGITMASLLHDVSQLRRVYGPDDAQSILGAHHVSMALRSLDPHTAAFLDAVIGSDPHPSLPDGTGVARLRRIPAGHAIVMIGESEPRLLRLPSMDDPLLRLELEGFASGAAPADPAGGPAAARPAPPSPEQSSPRSPEGIRGEPPPRARRSDDALPDVAADRDGDGPPADAPEQGRHRRPRNGPSALPDERPEDPLAE